MSYGMSLTIDEWIRDELQKWQIDKSPIIVAKIKAYFRVRNYLYVDAMVDMNEFWPGNNSKLWDEFCHEIKDLQWQLPNV